MSIIVAVAVAIVPCEQTFTDLEIGLLLQLDKPLNIVVYPIRKLSVTHEVMGVWMILVTYSHTAAHVREHERPGDDGRSEAEGSDAEDGDDSSQWYGHRLVCFI